MKIRRVLLLFFTAAMHFVLLRPAAVGAQDFHNISLNGTWDFKTDRYNEGLREKWYSGVSRPANWDTIAVPGVWDTRNEYAHYTGPAWYHREISVPADWEGQAIRLYFEAVYNDVQLWLNGEKIGEHHVGFLPFQLDITSHLQYGASNHLVLRVDNTFKRGALWNWGGIRRPVHLEVTGKARLEYQHITAVPHLDQGNASVDVSFLATNIAAESRELAYRWELFDAAGPVRFSGKAEGVFTLGAKDSALVALQLQLPESSVKLWHFNSPHLYTARLSLLSDGEVIHEFKDRFGIRKVEADGETLKLNGEAIRTVGFNLVPEDRVHGSALPLSRIMEDVDMMKSLGANMARLSHLPLPDEFLDYLDEKGILVFEEVSLWGKDKMVDPEAALPEYWLETMIRYKYNHPSIIGWSVGNEIGFLSANPQAMEYVESAIRRAKKLDPERLAVYVSHSAAAQKTDPAVFSDMLLINAYGGWGRAAEKVHANQPGKPVFYTEYGNALNNEDPNLGQVDAAAMLNQMRGKPYLMGASLWTFNDYRSFWQGREGWATPPSENRAWGIVNVFRQPKKAYYTLKKEYAPVKKLGVSHSISQLSAGALVNTRVHLVPRDVLDIPAYLMEDYKLVWEVSAPDGKLQQGGFEKLPVIHPGDPVVEPEFSWTVPAEQAGSLKISLLDPQDYAVYDTTVYLAKPAAPNISSTHSASNSIRVVFERPPMATACKLRYGRGDLSHESPSTIGHFIDIDGLEQGETYQLQLVAVNSAGESEPSETLRITTDEDVLPPVIWKTVPADKSFFLGYTVADQDYLYEIQYGTDQGDFEHFHTIGLRNVKGVCQVPGLENGRTYYYRLRRRMQWGFASEWTREIAVVPGLDQRAPSPPKPAGLIRGGTEALLIFKPAENATGYDIRYTHEKTGERLSMHLNASQVNYCSIGGLEKNASYRFEIATAAAGGQSEFVAFASAVNGDANNQKPEKDD